VHLNGPFVLIKKILYLDRNQPGSHRSELKSCKDLKVEQT